MPVEFAVMKNLIKASIFVSVLGAPISGLFMSPAFSDDTPQQDPAMSRPPKESQDTRIPDRLKVPEARKNEDELDGVFAFDYLKKLSGEWSARQADGHERPGQTFEVHSAGRLLLGTSFPGTDQELVSVFHLDGEDLVLVIYDPAGSEPRLRFDPRKSYPGRYYFRLAGGTGFDRTRDRHIHEASIKFLNVNQIEMEWVTFDGLTRSGTRSLRLERSPAGEGDAGSH
jgi:hypothetical protein